MPAIRFLVGVPVVVDPLHDRLYALVVPRVGGADEEVVRDVDARQQREEALGVAVGQLLRGDALALGRLRDRLAVLVGAGEEEDLLAALAHVPGQDVGADRRVRVAEVRRGVDVVDRRGDVEGHLRRQRLAVGRELPALGPVLVVDLVDVDLDVLGTDLVGVDERLGDAGHEPALALDVSR